MFVIVLSFCFIRHYVCSYVLVCSLLCVTRQPTSSVCIIAPSPDFVDSFGFADGFVAPSSVFADRLVVPPLDFTNDSVTHHTGFRPCLASGLCLGCPVYFLLNLIFRSTSWLNFRYLGIIPHPRLSLCLLFSKLDHAPHTCFSWHAARLSPSATLQLLLHQQRGHQGVKQTTELVCQCCYWPGMCLDIWQ